MGLWERSADIVVVRQVGTRARTRLRGGWPRSTCPQEIRQSGQHLPCRIDTGLAVEQQPHHRLLAYLGSHDQARSSILPVQDGGSKDGVSWGKGAAACIESIQ